MSKYITRPDPIDEQIRLALTSKPLDRWDQIELRQKLDAATGYIKWLQLALNETELELLNVRYQAGMLEGIDKPRASKRRKEKAK